MQENKCDGVYGLVTNLCENQLIRNNKRFSLDAIKKLRSKTFEILLTRNPLYHHEDPMWLENCNDYHCQFLAWEYMLRNEYAMQKEADCIENCVVQLLSIQSNKEMIPTILHFLLKLRKPPNDKPTIIESDVNLTRGNTYRIFKSDDFELEQGLLYKNSTLPNYSFTLPKSKHHFYPRLPSIPSLTTSSSASNGIPFDEGYESPTSGMSHIDLWANLSNMVLTKRRTWESCGDPAPAKEPLFCSEAVPEVYTMLNQLQLYERLGVINETNPGDIRILTKPEFIKDLKLLVVGLESGTFPKHENENYFRINTNVLFEGFSQRAFANYCNLMINCGICYKALSAMVSNITASFTAQNGYVYTEFCSAIDRYLLFYRIAALNFKDTNGLFEYHAHIRKLSHHLFVIAAMCKVGAYEDESSPIPRGMQLINYLFTNVYSHVDTNILNVLYAILFPCLQVYLMRFLRPWLIEGYVNDPYNEFFIRTTHKYLETRGRTYWTRSFTICDEMVPGFLQEFKWEIFNCGKVMNTLRLCVPKSIICEYLAHNKLNIIHCCMTSEQLTNLENCVRGYQLEVHSLGGASFSLKRMLVIQEDEKLIFSKSAVAKQAATIRRIQLKKVEKAQKQAEAKRKVMKILRDEYQKAIVEKEERRLAELARELKENEKLMEMREKEEKIIKEEAEKMIAYYNELALKSDSLTASIESHIEVVRSIQLVEEPSVDVESSDSDVVNANSDDTCLTETLDEVEAICDNRDVHVEINSNSMPDVRPLQKNKETYLREELGFTDAQINRNRVMGTSIATWKDDPHVMYKVITDAQRHKAHVSKSERQLNKERNQESCLFVFDDRQENRGHHAVASKQEAVKAEDVHLFNIDFDPATYYPSVFTNCMKTPNFELITSPICSPMIEHVDVDFSKRFPQSDVKHVKVQFLDYCIRHSISMPLEVQSSLIKNELLRYFIVDLKYLDHLEYLRNYYFLLDGEYARNLTEDLFDRLYYLDNPVELLNVRTLKGIINTALDSSIRPRIETQRIGFRINKMHVKDGNVLDCLSLIYEVKWPLNILLPTDTIGKYDEIFKCLLSVSRVTWVLKNIFKDMKMLHKLTGHYGKYLMLSKQFKKVHLFRHIMTHFVQTYQNYIVGEVLQSSWSEHQHALENIETLDDLYTAHTSYVKKIYFLCLLNKKSAPMRKVIVNIFTTILKFYDYMRSREWVLFENEFIHPNFSQLNDIFVNFMKQAKYFFKVGRKVARAAYQPQFVQLIDSLDVNKYYSQLFHV